MNSRIWKLSTSPPFSPKKEKRVLCLFRVATRNRHNTLFSFLGLKGGLVESFHILEFMEAHQPAAVVHAAADCGEGHPLAFADLFLADQFDQRGGDTGVG